MESGSVDLNEPSEDAQGMEKLNTESDEVEGEDASSENQKNESETDEQGDHLMLAPSTSRAGLVDGEDQVPGPSTSSQPLDVENQNVEQEPIPPAREDLTPPTPPDLSQMFTEFVEATRAIPTLTSAFTPRTNSMRRRRYQARFGRQRMTTHLLSVIRELMLSESRWRRLAAELASENHREQEAHLQQRAEWNNILNKALEMFEKYMNT